MDSPLLSAPLSSLVSDAPRLVRSPRTVQWPTYGTRGLELPLGHAYHRPDRDARSGGPPSDAYSLQVHGPLHPPLIALWPRHLSVRFTYASLWLRFRHDSSQCVRVLSSLQLSFAFVLFPLAISVAVSVRVGSALVNKRVYSAALSSAMGLVAGSGAAIGLALLLLKYREVAGYVVTGDEDVQYRVGTLARPAALFIIVDAVQGCCQGALRGMGRQRLLAAITLGSTWALAVPLGLCLAFVNRPQLGLSGLWYGFAVGAGFSACLQIYALLLTDWTEEGVLLLERTDPAAMSVVGVGGGERAPSLFGGAGMRSTWSYLPLTDRDWAQSLSDWLAIDRGGEGDQEEQSVEEDEVEGKGNEQES